MRKFRHIPAHCLINKLLAEAIRKMVITADNMGYAHIMIVNHDCKHVSWVAVRTQEYHIIQFRCLNCNIALNMVIDGYFTFKRRF